MIIQRKNLYLHFIIIIIIFFNSIIIAEEMKVSLITEPSWAPFYGKDLENGGYLTEIIREAFKVQGYSITVDWKPWARAVRETELGLYDGLLGTYYNEEREEQMAYSDPIDSDEIVFLSKKGRGITYNKLTDLIPYVIGTGIDFTYTEEFDKADYLEKQAVVDTETNIRKLIYNRTDLFVDSKYVVLYLIQTKFPDHKDALEILSPELESQNFHIGFSRMKHNYEQLVQIFNQGLRTIKENGTYYKIQEQYGFADK